jgi:hypothetical protein
MLDKTILVFYIEVGNIDPSDIDAYIEKMKLRTKTEYDSEIIKYYIPTRGEKNSRIECVNKQIIVTEENYKKYFSTPYDISKKLDRIVSIFNAWFSRKSVLFEKNRRTKVTTYDYDGG